MELADISALENKLSLLNDTGIGDEDSKLYRYQMVDPLMDEIKNMTEQIETINDAWSRSIDDSINHFNSYDGVNLDELEMPATDDQCLVASEIDLEELIDTLTMGKTDHIKQAAKIADVLTTANSAPNTHEIIGQKLGKLGENVIK